MGLQTPSRSLKTLSHSATKSRAAPRPIEPMTSPTTYFITADANIAFATVIQPIAAGIAVGDGNAEGFAVAVGGQDDLRLGLILRLERQGFDFAAQRQRQLQWRRQRPRLKQLIVDRLPTVSLL